MSSRDKYCIVSAFKVLGKQNQAFSDKNNFPPNPTLFFHPSALTLFTHCNNQRVHNLSFYLKSIYLPLTLLLDQYHLPRTPPDTLYVIVQAAVGTDTEQYCIHSTWVTDGLSIHLSFNQNNTLIETLVDDKLFDYIYCA